MSPNAFGYSELAGLMFDVKLVIRVGAARAHATLRPSVDYPLMSLVSCDEAPPHSGHR
jgi:hypothetical protein